MISWVIGRGGLLGRSVELALAGEGRTWCPAARFSWGEPERLGVELAATARDFATVVGSRPWQIAWCAGAGVVGTMVSVLDGELAAFSSFLTSLGEVFTGRLANGALFLASSAGGLYAGVDDPPYSESSPVAPLALYGWKKLEQEQLAARFCNDIGLALFVGRLSNLYGPGQDLAKGQGLITQVCLRVLARQPLHLYVPLDTIRDYLYADDAGCLVAAGLARLRREVAEGDRPSAVVKILASQQPVTVGNVLAQLRWITKRPASVIIGTSPNTHLQVRDLRMISTVWPELDQRPFTPLSEGMRAVLTRILELAGAGQFGLDALGGS